MWACGIHRLEEFYEEGERDILLDEVSKLRDQVHIDLTKISFVFCLLSKV